jgi:hypothetical protein
MPLLLMSYTNKKINNRETKIQMIKISLSHCSKVIVCLFDVDEATTIKITFFETLKSFF